MKNLFLRYNILIFLFILFVIGFYIYFQGIKREPTLKNIVLTDFKISCSEREKAGKRYLWIKSDELDLLSSVGRILNCDEYQSKEYSSIKVLYTLENNKIYNLNLDSKEVISISTVKSHIAQTMATAYLIICIMLSGLYYGFRRQYKEAICKSWE